MDKVEKPLRVALAGNANVGKSVIFNQLTGLHQHVGNWPGKTVERAEGTLSFAGYTIDILDLPGIYSLSTYSIEELVSREYIAVDRPDVIIDIVDASALERNLFFTLQLLELEPRMVIALNQVDIAESKGIHIDTAKLSKLLGVPVIPTVATKNIGLQELIAKVVEVAGEERRLSIHIRYGPEVEKRIETLIEAIGKVETPYPKRWIAIKMLEGDNEVKRIVHQQKPSVEELEARLKKEIEEIHGHDAPSVIASERYAIANKIAAEASTYLTPRTTLTDWLNRATSHPVLGYVIMAAIVLAVFYGIFSFGDYFSGLLGEGFGALKAIYEASFEGPIAVFVWDGLVEGIVAGITIALPYIVPFYIVLSILEDSGYLARIAFLMDSAMHRIGLHGKGFIPLMLGFGCNVPACLGCRIMETERERLICAFVTSLVPCAARSVVIMGLVAEYVGFQWAITLYLIDFTIIFALGRLAFKVVPGEPMGLIMEMPPYRWPTLRVTASKTWFKLKDFVYTAFPIMVAGNFIIQLANLAGLLNLVQGALTPVTVWWLGLPAATGVVLIFGILRKELTLILLASLMGTSNFALVLTPTQMFVFAFVVMIYIPCVATIAVLAKEFGYRRTAIITLTEIGLAISLGGVLLRILTLLGFS
jgi:ferrous iron transport protein B